MIRIIGGGKAGKLVCVCHPVEFAAVNDGAAYGCVMSVQVLGRGVGDDIGAPFDRPAVDGSGKGVIYDERYAVRVSCLCETLDVKDDECGVGDGLAENSLGVGAESLFELFVAAVRIDESEFDAHLAHCDIEKVERTAINRRGAHNMVAAGRDVEDTEKVSGLA